MHMADALLSPAVGGAMWCASGAAIAYSSRKVAKETDDRKVPLMGVLGAFLFAAQMINFAIPGTGSSGHLGGGILLAVLLGPHAALLTVASVLVIQALFFADGGLLALGCNIFNIGIIPAFVVYPLVYRTIAGAAKTGARTRAAVFLSALAALQLGPLAVVLETWLSGISSLPVGTFLLLMLPIHLAIGAVEGVVTVALLSFFRTVRPEAAAAPGAPGRQRAWRRLLVTSLALALCTGGFLSSFASKKPDGLEWAVARAAGGDVQGSRQGISAALAAAQEKTAIMPDYSFPATAGTPAAAGSAAPAAGTGVAGIVGTLLTLVLALLGGLVLKRKRGAVS